MRNSFLLLALLFCFRLSFAHQPTSLFTYEFVQNKGQWAKPILYSTELPQGWLFLEKDRFTYNFFEKEYFNLEDETLIDKKFKGHAFQVQFVNTNPKTQVLSKNKTLGYRNYFIGNDPAKWATDVNAFSEIIYQDLYAGIDLRLYSVNNSLKYDYMVAPKGDVAAIKMNYQGAGKMSLKDGKLHIKTSVNELIEEKPYAYQVINGIKQEVACSFTLNYQEVGFSVTGNYNKNLPLIIDPEIVFVTYTGGLHLNSANCATGDTQGNAYSGVQALGGVYPVTSGAYQTTRRGNNVAISKFSSKGNNLLYATYLGGNNTEYPLNLLVTNKGELLVVGSTTSQNFPILSNSYDATYNLGVDLFITKLSSNGSELLAATYLGGSQSETAGSSAQPVGLAIDKDGNIVVGGSTLSMNFPTLNPYQQTKKSGSDAFVTKLDGSLSRLVWSTFLGGSGDDIIADIKIGASGKIYITGNTLSIDFPVSGGAINSKILGNKDGFISILNTTGVQLQSSTYLGTTEADLAEILALDTSENVYVMGFTFGTYPQTTGTYGTPNATGGYFLHKLNNTLTNTFWSTHIGNASNQASFSFPPIPNAFQVDVCGNINFSAFSLVSCPVTNDAFEKSRRSLFICQLSTDAKRLVYGSYFGGLEFGHNHPGNQGYISEAGALYNIECVTQSEYPVTPGAYSVKKSGGVNDGVIAKFQISSFIGPPVKAEAEVPPPSCAPYPVQFKNTTSGGVTYSWNFGDGTPESTATNPSHTFQKAGKYRVRLIAFNPAICQFGDTTFLQVEVLGPPVSSLPDQVAYLCSNSITLDAGNPGYTYLWSTGETTQTISVTQRGEYKVKIAIGYCEINDSITVENPLPPVEAPNIITPNQDSKNDFFVIKNTAPGTRLKIYNRWGNLVFKDDDYQNTWNGKNLSKGTYFYHIQSPGSCTTEKGWVEIVQ